MPRGLYRDTNGLVVVSHGSWESPMPVRNYVASELLPPVDALPTRAAYHRGRQGAVNLASTEPEEDSG